MDLRRAIDRLIGLGDGALRAPTARAEAEEILQRGLAAIQIGELWITYVARELDRAESNSERVNALLRELRGSVRSVNVVRRHVERLLERTRRFGVGSSTMQRAG